MLLGVRCGPMQCIECLDKYWLYCHYLQPDPQNKSFSKDKEAGVVQTGPSEGQDPWEPPLPRLVAPDDPACCPSLLPQLGHAGSWAWVEGPETNFSQFQHRGSFVTFSSGIGFL